MDFEGGISSLPSMDQNIKPRWSTLAGLFCVDDRSKSP